RCILEAHVRASASAVPCPFAFFGPLGPTEPACAPRERRLGPAVRRALEAIGRRGLDAGRAAVLPAAGQRELVLGRRGPSAPRGTHPPGRVPHPPRAGSF